MPDEHGRLDEADNDLIQRWWNQHSNDQVICPVCKTTSWKTAAHLVNIQSYAPDANSRNTPTYPHIIVTCKLCAHSMFFNAVQIGIAPQIHRWRSRFRLGTEGHSWAYSELGGFNQ
jgi:hypothetical protein